MNMRKTAKKKNGFFDNPFFKNRDFGMETSQKITEKRRKAPGFSREDGQAVSRLRVSVGATQFPLAF
jgi:hypothetical protein